MPDIQTAFKTALSKTLQQWDDDGEAPPLQPVSSCLLPPTNPTQTTTMKKTFNITNNISRVTFDYIKNNPGSTRKEIIQALEHQGFAGGSTSSLIAQMRRNNMVHEKDNFYYADIPEYRPIKSLKALRKIDAPVAPPKRKYEKRAVTGIGALLKERLDSTPMPIVSEHTAPKQRGFMTTLVRTRSPEDILKDMTVYQAHELYVHLKQMFGG